MLGVSRWVVRALAVLNVVAALALAALLAGTFLAESRVLAELSRAYPDADMKAALHGARLALGLVVPVAVAAHLIFARLLSLLDSVAGGDPFVAVNGERLRTIARALLVIQICDVLFGIVGTRVDLALGERVSGWSPGITGWVAVLLLFVLARVFREGARMRDDLALTV